MFDPRRMPPQPMGPGPVNLEQPEDMSMLGGLEDEGMPPMPQAPVPPPPPPPTASVGMSPLAAPRSSQTQPGAPMGNALTPQDIVSEIMRQQRRGF